MTEVTTYKVFIFMLQVMSMSIAFSMMIVAIKHTIDVVREYIDQHTTIVEALIDLAIAMVILLGTTALFSYTWARLINSFI